MTPLPIAKKNFHEVFYFRQVFPRAAAFSLTTDAGFVAAGCFKETEVGDWHWHMALHNYRSEPRYCQ
jgi:hypothetical protein